MHQANFPDVFFDGFVVFRLTFRKRILIMSLKLFSSSLQYPTRLEGAVTDYKILMAAWTVGQNNYVTFGARITT